MISVIWNSASVIEGRMSAFSPLAVSSPVDQPQVHDVAPRPKEGSQPSCTENT